ncbi:MAG: hypothetical protein ACLQVI_12875 [Polyangiaceae bacterium]
MREPPSPLAHVKSCLDVTERDVASALGDRETARALLDKLAKVARPGEGGPKALVFLARLAREDVAWIEGMLRVELAQTGDATTVEVLSDLGVGMRERVFPPFTMSVPLEEFTRLAERLPDSIAPLAIRSKSARKLVLKALWEDDGDMSSVLPPAVSIADESLYGRARRRSSKPRSPAAPPAQSPRHAPQRSRKSTMRPDRGAPPPHPSVMNLRVPLAPPIPRGEPTTEAKRGKPPSRAPTPLLDASNPKSVRGRVAIPRSEPPDEEGLDGGWDDKKR